MPFLSLFHVKTEGENEWESPCVLHSRNLYVGKSKCIYKK
ncbi:conserved hypothetical protein [Bacillus sp. IT-79MI2]|nr:hypothetical protein BTH41_04610 [Bacillus mycoides]